jgi:pimeloyl-ACP methyl ester carboxylesterase
MGGGGSRSLISPIASRASPSLIVASRRAVRGIPDPKEFAGDLAALIEHLQLPDVRLVAQSMGGWTSTEYILANLQHEVRALVLASTCGTPVVSDRVFRIEPDGLVQVGERVRRAGEPRSRHRRAIAWAGSNSETLAGQAR